MIAQVLGASIGYGLLILVTPAQFMPPGTCMTLPIQSMSTAQLFVIEFFITATLTFVVSGVWDPRNRDFGDSIPLRVGEQFLNFKKPLKHFSFLGITVSAIGLCAGLPTGASMNPARSFGPALWNWNWDYHWVYWVAPMLGSTLAGLFYRGVFWKKNPKDEALEPVVEETETETSNK